MSADLIPLGPATELVFAEPWEAQVFALVVELHDRGLFSWITWAEALGAHTRRTGRAADYAAWLDTLEGLLAARDVLPPASSRSAGRPRELSAGIPRLRSSVDPDLRGRGDLESAGPSPPAAL